MKNHTLFAILVLCNGLYFIENLAEDAQCFKNMNIHPELSYSNWFRTFVASEDFRKMDNDQQKEAFKHYENSVYAIRTIAEFFDENDVINYKSSRTVVMQ